MTEQNRKNQIKPKKPSDVTLSNKLGKKAMMGTEITHLKKKTTVIVNQ
jgi:hypothetical protein